MANNILFGNDNAENDALLFDCKINHSSYDSSLHYIITGRWGTGKSAQLFLLNEKLIAELAKVNPKYDQIWYIKEDDLNFSSLFAESLKYGDIRNFRKTLETIWQAEILRRAIVILGHLNGYYGDKPGLHWEMVRKSYNKTSFTTTLWKQLPNVISILTSKEKGSLVGDMQDDLSNIFRDNVYEQIQQCLLDIIDYQVKPIIAVEPLETPNSELDKQVSLAQQVVTSLLNVFESKFQPSRKQLLEVYLAIPWHRYKIQDINLPGKILEYKYYLQWSRDELREFINERISWEFKRVGRTRYEKKNAWYELFDNSIQRDNFEIPIKEDTFDYALRFTHHRPRDIQTLTRLAVFEASKAIARSKEDILRGTGGFRINGSHLRQAVHAYRKEACKLLIEEVTRGNPFFKDVLNLVAGLPARFEKEVLFERTKSGVTRDGIINQNECISMLWDAGIIGIEMSCSKEQQSFYALLPEETKKTDHNVNGVSITRGYFFEYNNDDDIHQLLNKYSHDHLFDIKIVFHPKTFDTLISQQTTIWPIGI